MSAILSVFNRNGRPVDRHVVDTLLAASQDRSVDGQEVWIDDYIALAHQHFWITPQEWGERQPLVDSAGCRTIVADARLDNRDELIRLLNRQSSESNQLSDAAIILLAYQRWGTSCVEKFLGDFAFAIWDADEEFLFFARDPLGTRGLCHAIVRDLCLVGSEVAQLLAHPAIDPQINERKIAAYLVGLWGDQEDTYFENIHYCPPAHCLVVTSESVRKWRYWDIDPQSHIRYRDDQEYADHFLELLTDAVRCRLRTVGPVGISMSGGLDSTTLAALASKLLPQTGLPQKHLKSFSYVFDELAGCDERRYIAPVVERYQLEATYIPCDDKWTLRDIENWPVLAGFVYHDPYAWLPDSVMTAAEQEGCRVLLAGYYGDVLFLGGIHWAAGMMGDRRFGELAKVLAGSSGAIDWRRDLMLNGLRHMIPHPWRMNYGQNRSNGLGARYPGMHPRMAELAQMQIGRDREHARQRRLLFGPDHWHRYLGLTVNLFAQGFSAVRFQYNKHGLELLMPYWDRRLVEYVMAVPADQLGRPGRDRWLLRNAVADLLPKRVVERRQQTEFTPLMNKGLLEKETATVNEIMKKPLIVEKDYVPEKWLRQQLIDGKGWTSIEDSYYLWKCLSLELWLKLVLSIRSDTLISGGQHGYQ